MTYHLDIPESIAASLRLPEPEIETRLRIELALALYAQGTLPFGKASELADISRFAFADMTTRREVSPALFGARANARSQLCARSVTHRPYPVLPT